MLFRGLREIRTTEPKQLAADLRRLNIAIEDGFAEAEQTFEAIPRVVRVVESSYTASHGDFVIAGFNQPAVILLPRSSPETATRRVRVVQVGVLYGVTVAAQSDQTVNGTASTTLGAYAGYRDYIDDGLGNWWGPAL